MGRTRAIHARLTRLKLLLRAASKKRRGVGENKTVAAVNLTDRTKPQMYFIRISFRNSKKFNQKLQLSLGEQYTTIFFERTGNVCDLLFWSISLSLQDLPTNPCYCTFGPVPNVYIR